MIRDWQTHEGSADSGITLGLNLWNQDDYKIVGSSLQLMESYILIIFTKVCHLGIRPYTGTIILQYRHAQYEDWFSIPSIHTPPIQCIGSALVGYVMVGTLLVWTRMTNLALHL